MKKAVRSILIFFAFLTVIFSVANSFGFGALPIYLKLEAEDFAGIGEAGAAWQQNMAWYPHWSRGGSSGWWSVQGTAASESGEISREIFVPAEGEYTLWVRYEDYAGEAEAFDIKVDYEGGVAKSEFGRNDIISQKDKQIAWNYVWDQRKVKLKKGKATVRIVLNGKANVRRGIDALIFTNDANWKPVERGFPPLAYSQYLKKWAEKRQPLQPLVNKTSFPIPTGWNLPKTAGRDFWSFTGRELVADFPFPLNISPEGESFAARTAYIARNKKAPATAPVFGAANSAIQIPITQIAQLLKPDNPLAKYILSEKRPFVLVGNYNSAGQIKDSYSQLKQIFGELWVGIISGENTYLEIPFYPPISDSAVNFKEENYAWLFGEGKKKWQERISGDWNSSIEKPFEKVIPALSVGTLPHIHQLAEAGVDVLAAESAAAMPYIPAQIAFVRGAARQYGKRWTWYYGASFGDAIRTFTKEHDYFLELEGMKIEERNAVVGPSLAHIRRALLFSYLQGANFFHPEQGYNLFDTNGELNPMGWAYDELARLSLRHPNRGVINTPVAFLLDKNHGWDKYSFNGMRLWNKKTLSPGDQMINQLLNVAYFPFPKNEGDPANDLNIPYPNGYFGNIFDVIVSSPSKLDAVDSYPVIFLAGELKPDKQWMTRLKKYVSDGGTLVFNAKQLPVQFDENFFGAKLTDVEKESDTVICKRDGEILQGTPFSYRLLNPTTAEIIAQSPNGDALALRHKFGKGQVILTAPSYLLGYDEVPLPFTAHLLLELTSQLQPLEIRGNAEYFVNLRPDGYVVTVSNNEGITKLSHSAAMMDKSKTAEISFTIKENPLATEDWLGEEPRPWNFPNEWLPEFTQPKPLEWKKTDELFQANLKLLPGEIRVYFIKTK
jgi:hypothetical protein